MQLPHSVMQLRRERSPTVPTAPKSYGRPQHSGRNPARLRPVPPKRSQGSICPALGTPSAHFLIWVWSNAVLRKARSSQRSCPRCRRRSGAATRAARSTRAVGEGALGPRPAPPAPCLFKSGSERHTELHCAPRRPAHAQRRRAEPGPLRGRSPGTERQRGAARDKGRGRRQARPPPRRPLSRSSPRRGAALATKGAAALPHGHGAGRGQLRSPR